MTATVPHLIVATVLKFARREGYDVEQLSQGLSFSERRLRWPGAGVPWNDVAELFARLESCHPDALRRFAERYVNSFPLLTWLATYVLSPAPLYRLTLRGWSRVWPMRLTIHQTEQGFEVDGEGPPGLRCGASIYRLGAEILRLLPTTLGYAPARVEYEEALPHFAWRVYVPHHHRGTEDDDDSVETAFHALVGDVLPVLAPPSIPASWGLTPAEARVVEHIVAGLTVRQAAGQLYVNPETVRTHLKRAMTKAGVHRQAELVARVHGSARPTDREP